MSVFKKIKLFFTYIEILKTIKKELELEYNARVDNIYRIYSVVNIPEELFEEPYNFRTSDINIISRNFLTDYRTNFSQFLVSKGLLELFDFYEIRKVDKFSYLVIIGYSLINTKKFVNNLIIWLFGFIIFSIFGLLIYLMVKTYI